MEFHKEIKEHELELASILIPSPSGVLRLKVVFVDQRMDRMPQTLRRPCEGVYNMASVRSMSRDSSWGQFSRTGRFLCEIQCLCFPQFATSVKLGIARWPASIIVSDGQLSSNSLTISSDARNWYVGSFSRCRLCRLVSCFFLVPGRPTACRRKLVLDQLKRRIDKYRLSPFCFSSIEVSCFSIRRHWCTMYRA
jgi:hypothetical protein